MKDSQSKTQFTPQRWQRLQEIFERALPLAPEARKQLLLEQCQDDITLREQVMSLLLASPSDEDDFEHRYERAIGNLLHEAEVPGGTRVGPYRIQRLLGRGGMGAVYLAERADGQYQQTVAIKLVDRGILRMGMGDRFRSERQILARLSHANIARLLDGGHTEDGTPYFVMEYIAGLPLDVYCQQRKLTTHDRLRLMQQVCGAVEYAHQNLVIHRDLKPSNILVCEDGTPKLLDFGIAKLLEPQAPGAGLTRLRERILTPEHASPEQIRGEPTATVSDVYGLGVLLYQLLTGEHPYTPLTRTLSELERYICEEDPQPPSARAQQRYRQRGITPFRDLARELAGDLDNIVVKAMHREPSRRYQSAAALARDLQNYLDGMPVEARADTFAYRVGKFLRRHTWATASAVATAAIIAGLTAFYTSRLAAERDRAQLEATKAKQVASFLGGIFKRSDPWGARGRQITAVELLDRGANDIESQLHDQPVTLAELLFDIANCYKDLAEYDRAGKMFERVLALKSAAGLANTAEYARTLYELANARRYQARFSEAEQDFKQALQLQRRLFPGPNGDTSATLTHLGSLYYEMQRYEEAAQLEREALAMATAVFGTHNEETADRMNNLALALQAAGHYPEAEQLFRTVVEIQAQVMPPLHPDALGDKFNLALLLDAMGHYVAAESLMRELLPKRRAVLGGDHPSVGFTLTGLGSVLTSLGKFDEAEKTLDEALAIVSAKLGPDHFRTGNVVRNLGLLALARGNSAEAEKLFQRAADIAAKAFGDSSDGLQRTRALVATTWLRLGRTQDGQTLLESSYEKLYGNGKDPASLPYDRTLEELGKLRTAQGRLDEAASLYQRALDRYRRHGVPQHPWTAEALLGLAQLALLHSQPAEAVSASNQALENLRRELPESHWEVALARQSLDRARLAARERQNTPTAAAGMAVALTPR